MTGCSPRSTPLQRRVFICSAFINGERASERNSCNDRRPLAALPVLNSNLEATSDSHERLFNLTSTPGYGTP